jgi:hypothetical protein
VLDFVIGEYDGLRTRLGAFDRDRIEEHLDSIRSIEMRLDATVNQLANPSCTKPAAPPSGPDYQTRGRLHMDLIVMALACDLTRVASLLWENAADHAVNFAFAGTTVRHHDAAHGRDTAALVKITTWFATQFDYLLTRMKAVEEGDRTLLDNTVVMWWTEMSDGASHSNVNTPFLLAGSAGGSFRTGRWLRFPGKVRHANLFVSIQNAMGIPSDTFGRPDWCTGPLSQLNG